MALTSPFQLLAALRASRLLTPAQLQKLEADLRDTDETSTLVDELIARGTLTEYQAIQLLAGFGDSLLLGQYRILDRLGEGGMAQVYKAEHMVMKRLVALKVIASRPTHPVSPNGHHEDVSEAVFEEAIERFHHEVQIAARLDHPNIVRAYDAAEDRGLFFLVMEYVDGMDLGQRVEDGGPLPVPAACDYMRQAALGLQYAHEHGLIHRDIKPSNLLVTKNGLVKILDLGLARLAVSMPQEFQAASRGSDGCNLAGTPDYMAPEAAHDSRCCDIRSDLYSLGCTFYYLLTGQVPYPGGGWPEKLLRHQLDSTPSVVVIRPDVPADLAAILQRLMAKDPAERFASPGHLVAALEAWQAAHQAEVHPSSALLTPPACGSSTPTVNLVSLTPQFPPQPDAMNQVPEASSSPAMREAIRAAQLKHRSRLPWPVGLAAAAIVGLTVALLLRGPQEQSLQRSDSSSPVHSVAAGQGSPGGFTVEGISEEFPTLAAAVAAAPDEAVITIHGQGPFLLKPTRIVCKRLTLRADGDARPTLRFDVTAKQTPWQPMIATDRSLALEKLELVSDIDPAGSAPEISHLVYIERASLHLKNCLFRAANGSATVVCRGSPEAMVENCRFQVGSLPLCVENQANGQTTVTLRACELEITEPRGAALSLWSARAGSGEPGGTLHLVVENSTIQAGRIMAFGALPARIDVSARNNRFAFHEALLSFASSPQANSWRHATSWKEADNTYDAACSTWLQVNGAPAGVHNHVDWRQLWQE
jgi:serine/threonine protein kinase